MNNRVLSIICRKILPFLLLVPLSLFASPVFACSAPSERFCVDFYEGNNLKGAPVATRKAPYIKYNWERRRPTRTLKRNNFSARWRGFFEFTGGQYAFSIKAGGGVRLLLDGQSVVDHWNDNRGGEYLARLSPDAGIHLLEVEYSESMRDSAHVQVNWELDPLVITPLTINTVPVSSTGNDNKAPLGINLSYFSYSSSSVPFKDLMTQSGLKGVFKKGTNEPCLQQPPLNTAGYPQYLPRGCVFKLLSVFHIRNDDFWPDNTLPYKSGHYVLLYQGEGVIRLGWDAKNLVRKRKGRIEFDVPMPSAGIEIQVTKIDAANPIQNMQIVHVDDEASFRKQPFNDKWLNLLKPFKLIRFVDWGRVNEKVRTYSGVASSHTSKSISLSSTVSTTLQVSEGSVVMVNINGKWPRVMVELYDEDTRTLYLKTLIEISENGNQPTVYIYDFLNRTWADRTQPVTLEQGSPKGIAFEKMIQLANTLNADAWINIPTAANDDFIEQLASLIKTKLKPNLKCYIEYSNETWNTGFPGYDYAEAKAKELGLQGTSPQADSWQAYRAVEVFKIFNRVFGEPDLREERVQSRIVRVLTSQTVWLARGLGVMDWVMPNNASPTMGQPAHKFADAWAGTTYFYMNDNQTLEQVTQDKLFSLQIDNINSMFGTPETPGIIRQTFEEVNTRGLQLLAYEGGTHLLAARDKPDLVAKLAESNKDQRMTEVYNHLLSQWDSLYQEFGAEKVGIWNHYSDVSRYSKYGYWGLLQSTYQDPMTAPKYQAIKEYISESP